MSVIDCNVYSVMCMRVCHEVCHDMRGYVIIGYDIRGCVMRGRGVPTFRKDLSVRAAGSVVLRVDTL